MSQLRKTLIYGNCQVFSPDGDLMFRCLEKRANWYLKRNLATIMSQDPLCIKLNFAPKGRGEVLEVLKMERFNRCVVCGLEELNMLTKHHLVPFVYRQHFPSKRKQHSSLFVVPICRNCHLEYENAYAYQLKTVLAEIHSAPLNGIFDSEKVKIIGAIRCLKQHGDKIPADRKVFLREKLKQRLIDRGIYNGEDISDDNVLEAIGDNLEKEKEKDDQAINCHGKIVVDGIKDFDEFEKMWARHFVDNMQPQYMPEYLLKTLCSFVSQPC